MRLLTFASRTDRSVAQKLFEQFGLDSSKKRDENLERPAERSSAIQQTRGLRYYSPHRVEVLLGLF